MDITLRLLGSVNQNTPTGTTVLPRYIAVVTPEQLATFLVYERTGSRKTDRYRLKPASFIQIDKEIQRGRDTEDSLLQLPAKIDDIATTLLGAARSAPPNAFLGSLIWNIRTTESNTVTAIKEEPLGGGMPTFKLRISADHVWLTDSAHRHLGIAEAYRRYVDAPAKFPRFRKDFEFVAEIYQLDRAVEKALFFELNALQKRITAAKRKEMDVISSEGYVKDVVRQHDESNRRLFEDNIEVTANQNIHHTLMTMSVFVSSIHEMFPKSDLNEAKDLPQKRAELAEFYCDFFYALHDTIKIVIDGPESGETRELTPYYNLYLQYIQPALNDLESDAERNVDSALDAARQVAKKLNERVRFQDIANHNATIKALCRLARLIRPMNRWERVIEYLQSALNAPRQGRFFQKSNSDLFAPPASQTDVTIAKLNDDGSINVQVQSQTIAALYRYLRKCLQLELPPVLTLSSPDPEAQPIVLSNRGAGEVRAPVSRHDGGTLTFEVAFFISGSEFPEDAVVKLAIEAPEALTWKSLQRTGAKRLLPVSIQPDLAYAHPIYDRDVSRHVATFALDISSAPRGIGSTPTIGVQIKAFVPDLDTSTSVETECSLTVTLE
jgi:hypothetical protein